MMLLSVLSPEVRCEWKLQDWEVAMISTVCSAIVSYSLCSQACTSLTAIFGIILGKPTAAVKLSVVGAWLGAVPFISKGSH